MVERLQALKDMHQQEVNRLEAHHASGETTVLANVKSHIVWLDERIAELQREINDHIDGHPELKQDADLIASIPGIGEATVAKVLAYAGTFVALPAPRHWLPSSGYVRVSGSLAARSKGAR
jgi:transposase